MLDIVILGLSITSSWGNGHATTYRALARALARRGHRVLFLERDVPWYRENRDLPSPDFCDLSLYSSLDELRDRFATSVTRADLVVVGSYVPDGIEVGQWVISTAREVTAFYDIDTPVTLAGLATGRCEYLAPQLIRGYDLYLSFTGGPTLEMLAQHYGSPMPRPLYCSVDVEEYYPEDCPAQFDLGYLGTHSADRQPTLERLLVEPARHWPEGRFVVAGPQFPPDLQWPANIIRTEHVAPREHRRFYNEQRATLNVTRADMICAGYSPSVRLFEAAACGTPVVTDRWEGIEAFFAPGSEIILADTSDDVLETLARPEHDLQSVGERARRRVLACHTSQHRALELEHCVREARQMKSKQPV